MILYFINGTIVFPLICARICGRIRSTAAIVGICSAVKAGKAQTVELEPSEIMSELPACHEIPGDRNSRLAMVSRRIA
jgi:hypothetical protein